MRSPSTESYELGEGGAPALLIHGFSGSPWELHPVAEHLAGAGFHVRVPRLPGHGQDAEALSRTGEAHWMAAVHDNLDRAVARGEKAFLVGFSMGACAVIRAAAERPRDVAALALLAPAISLRGNSQLYRRLFGMPLLHRFVPRVSKGRMDIRDQAMKQVAPYMPVLPTAAAHGLDRMIREANRALPQVRAPALVLWGAHDAVVPRKAAEWAAAKIGSGPVRLAVFERSAHQLSLDHDRDAVAEEIVRFFSHFRLARAG